MRYITLAAIALLVLSAGAGRSRGGILLEQGQRYDFSFDTLHLAGTETGVNQGGFTAYLGAGNALDTGDDVRVDLFQNAFSDPAFYSHDFTTPTTLFAATVVSPTPWQDLQGKLSFTMVSGSMILDRLTVRVIRDHLLYEDDIPIIPEPAALALALLAGAGARRPARRG